MGVQILFKQELEQKPYVILDTLDKTQESCTMTKFVSEGSQQSSIHL
jgi:hypothetical protein